MRRYPLGTPVQTTIKELSPTFQDRITSLGFRSNFKIAKIDCRPIGPADWKTERAQLPDIEKGPVSAPQRPLLTVETMLHDGYVPLRAIAAKPEPTRIIPVVKSLACSRNKRQRCTRHDLCFV